jgi:hypothetical protein
MTPAELRVRDLVDKWLQSLELHLRYATLDDDAYWRVRPWEPHQRPARWIVELAYARAQDLRHLLATRAAAGDAAFAEAVELTGFLANLVGAQHLERFIPIADPATENAAAFSPDEVAQTAVGDADFDSDDDLAADAASTASFDRHAPSAALETLETLETVETVETVETLETAQTAVETAVEIVEVASADAPSEFAAASDASTREPASNDTPHSSDELTTDSSSMTATAMAGEHSAASMPAAEPVEAGVTLETTANSEPDTDEGAVPAAADADTPTVGPDEGRPSDPNCRVADAPIAHVVTPTLTLTISMNAGFGGTQFGTASTWLTRANPAVAEPMPGTAPAVAVAAERVPAASTGAPPDATGECPSDRGAQSDSTGDSESAPVPTPSRVEVRAESTAPPRHAPVTPPTARVDGHAEPAARAAASPVAAADGAAPRAPATAPAPRPAARAPSPAPRRPVVIEPPKPVVPPTTPTTGFVTSPPLTLAALEARIATPRSAAPAPQPRVVVPPAAAPQTPEASRAAPSATAPARVTDRAAPKTISDTTVQMRALEPSAPTIRPMYSLLGDPTVQTPALVLPGSVDGSGTTAAQARASAGTSGSSSPAASPSARSSTAAGTVPVLDAAPALHAKVARKDGRGGRQSTRTGADSGTSQTVVADAVRLLKWGKEWHELADAISRMAGRPPVGEVRKMLRAHKTDIQKQSRH